MSTADTIFWMTMLLLGVAGMGLCAGLEIGLYTVNRVRLHLLAHKGRHNARVLEGILHQPAAHLGALLIATSAFANIVSGVAGVLLDSRNLPHWQVILYDVAIVTPLLFIFAEVLPKDLFSAYADQLLYPFARLIIWLTRGLQWTGVLPLLQGATNVALRVLGLPRRGPTFPPRVQMVAMVRESVGYGLLSDEQSAIVQRVVDLSDRTVGEEMIPWAKVLKVNADDPPTALWRLAEGTSVSRFPATDAQGKVVGVVSLYDALLHTPEHCPPIRDLARSAPAFERHEPLRQALGRLRRSDVGMAIVNDHGKPVGIVTIKDLIEPITGELASW
ncbi:MAG: CNNM domain-containing protein [Planctomycetota bacterium]|nr:CNNM domain-containing protein [Planctomycetota bacterium]